MNLQLANPFVLQWNLTNPDSSPLNNASVTATLYAGRKDPITNPGVPVSELNALPLPFVSNGLYQGNVPAIVSVSPGVNYVLVIEGKVANNVVYHVEDQVTLTVRSSTPSENIIAPSAFQPRFIFDFEATNYGLPSPDQLPNIMFLVDAASGLIDSYLGRLDGTGAGSLVYTTYSERLFLPIGRNILRTSFAPLIALSTDQVAQLQSFNSTGYKGVEGNHFWTGCQPNTVLNPAGNLSPIISASGRYGYGRRDQQAISPDLNYAANILMIAAFFGGPPMWTGIDVTQADYWDQVGEIWIPAGLYLSQYTEVIITYNAGFNPLAMPSQIKQATAALVKNFITRAGGTTGIKGYSAGRIHTTFTEELVDPTIDRMLNPFKRVQAM